jgi:hypothetical protein
MDRLRRGRLTKLKLAVASLFALTATAASAGQVTMFEGPAFQGDSASTIVAIPNLGSTRLEDGVSSVDVNQGTWEACSASRFRGHCVRLVPGSYATLSQDLDGKVMSIQEIGDSFMAGLTTLTPDRQPVAFNQSPVIVSPNAVPIVINAGQTPVVINAGAAPVVVPATPQVVTAAPPVLAVVPQATIAPQVVAVVPQVVNAPVVTAAVAPAGRVVLYQFPNFAGPSAVVDRGRAPDLDWAHFSYPATSLRVESGRWLACSHIGYQGDCLVFGPGDYPVLSGLLEQGVYSVRQVG